jgi:hypothetical protein
MATGPVFEAKIALIDTQMISQYTTIRHSSHPTTISTDDAHRGCLDRICNEWARSVDS